MSPRLVYDLPEAEYHADRTTVSSTGLKTLLRSPAKYRYGLDNPGPSTKAKDVGSLTHALVLGQPLDFVAKDWDERTKSGKERAAEVKAAGLTSVAEADWRMAHRMAEAVFANPIVRDLDLFTGGKPEVSVYAEHLETGVPLRGRIDYLHSAEGLLVDLKTSTTSDPSQWARSEAPKYDYPIQAADYWSITESNGINVNDFLFVVVEKEPPHLVSVIRIKPGDLERGYKLVERACNIWKKCTAFDSWPARADADDDQIVTVSMPRWWSYDDSDYYREAA